MSKIDTLINLINYKKQNPEANKKQIAQGIGITPQYLIQCSGELNRLKEHLTPSLEANQIRFLLSALDQHDPFQGEIHQQLQEYLSLSPHSGTLRMVRLNEHPTVGEFSIGEFTRATNGDLHPTIQFSLDRFCYDSLFWVHRSGEVEWRLATAVEPVDDFSTWRITLRADLHWSDGKPIRRKDVIQTISESRMASLIEEIKADGKNRLCIRLAKAESMFPQRLANIPIRPSHSHQPYRVTSGPYHLKRFRQKSINFRLVRNSDYYQTQKGGIDWITIKRFKHFARAIESLLIGKIDFIPLDALQPLYQTSNDLPLQQAPFFREAYYLMFLNRRQGPLRDESNCRRLKEAIDYRRINRYLHGEQHAKPNGIKSPLYSSLNLKIIYPREAPIDRYLANLVGKTIGTSDINSVFLEEDGLQKMWDKADLLLSRIYFGSHYSRLSQYFHSQGRHNSFGYANLQVDELLSQLDETMDITQRRVIGQKVMSLLEEDSAIILLSPHFQYLLSPLSIRFDASLTNHTDLIENMKHLVIERD